MTKTDPTNFIALGEGFTTEFKRSVSDNIGREICAFANSTGGVILVGFEDDGTVTGVSKANHVKSQVQSIARSADPPISIDIDAVGEVLCVTIPEQHSKPYSFRGKFYLRESASSQQMSRQEIREFLFKEGLIHFDETPCPDYDIASDLTAPIWGRFVNRAAISIPSMRL